MRPLRAALSLKTVLDAARHPDEATSGYWDFCFGPHLQASTAKVDQDLVVMLMGVTADFAMSWEVPVQGQPLDRIAANLDGEMLVH